eukprot:1829610-Alexandrium_andersonii.AAC.1
MFCVVAASGIGPLKVAAEVLGVAGVAVKPMGFAANDAPLASRSTWCDEGPAAARLKLGRRGHLRHLAEGAGAEEGRTCSNKVLRKKRPLSNR